MILHAPLVFNLALFCFFGPFLPLFCSIPELEKHSCAIKRDEEEEKGVLICLHDLYFYFSFYVLPSLGALVGMACRFEPRLQVDGYP